MYVHKERAERHACTLSPEHLLLVSFYFRTRGREGKSVV